MKDFGGGTATESEPGLGQLTEGTRKTVLIADATGIFSRGALGWRHSARRTRSAIRKIMDARLDGRK
jgi:hypothetical protein